jgi:hypothetical protein
MGDTPPRPFPAGPASLSCPTLLALQQQFTSSICKSVRRGRAMLVLKKTNPDAVTPSQKFHSMLARNIALTYSIIS